MMHPTPHDAYSTKRILTIIALSILMVGLVLLAYSARYMLLTAFIGVGLGVILIPLVGWLQRHLHIPRGVSGVIVLLLILSFLGGLTYAFGTFVSSQVEALSSQIPQIQENIQNQLNQIFSAFPAAQKQIQQFNLGNIAQRAMSWAMGGLQAGLSALAGIIVILALAIFTSVNSRRYLDGMTSAFPDYQRPHAREVFKGMGCALRSWFGAQVITMAIVAVLTSLGLLAIGVDYWLLFGVMAGLLDIIPFVGPILAAAITAMVSLGTADASQAMWVLGLFLVIQQLEGNVIFPLVMRGAAELPEVLLLVLLLVLSHWFGLLGALVAAPVLSIFHTLYQMTYRPQMDRKKIAPEVAAKASASERPPSYSGSDYEGRLPAPS